MAPRLLALLATACVLASGAALAPALASRAQEPPRLDAVVGTNDGFDIALKDAAGTRVSQIPAGTYTIVVHDRSALHNFHLASNFDSTVDFRTDVEFVGDQIFTVTFKADTLYAYACEPHFQTMNGRFFASGPASTVTTTAKPPPAPTKIVAAVSAGGSATLSPTSVRRGPARILVRDRSASANFHLAGPGVNRRTGRSFVGTTVWNVRLQSGSYRFGADPRPLKGVLRVRRN